MCRGFESLSRYSESGLRAVDREVTLPDRPFVFFASGIVDRLTMIVARKGDAPMHPSDSFVAAFHQYCVQQRLLDRGAHVLLAVSGGLDSVVLLDLLACERRAMDLRMTLAHMHHGLRGAEADADERFVRELGMRYDCAVVVERVDTRAHMREHGGGIQETARALRYDFLARARDQCRCDFIATAHHADDNAETMLHHFLRGSGVRGLAGIPVHRDDSLLVRPLMFATRTEIAAYATAHGLAYRTDSSNQEDHYTRNVIRHQLLPVIVERINPSVAQTLGRSAGLFRELDAYLTAEARRVSAGVVTGHHDALRECSIPALGALPRLLQQYLVMAEMQELTGLRPDQTAVEQVLSLASTPTGTIVHLEGGWEASRHRNTLLLRRRTEAAEFEAQVVPNTHYTVGQFVFLMEEVPTAGRDQSDPGRIEYVDAARVGHHGLVLRTWREGEWFVPLGMTGRKKVSDFLVDAHVPRFEKKQYPVLSTHEGDVVWLCGHRIDERFKVTPASKTLLRLHFTPRIAPHAQGSPG